VARAHDAANTATATALLAGDPRRHAPNPAAAIPANTSASDARSSGERAPDPAPMIRAHAAYAPRPPCSAAAPRALAERLATRIHPPASTEPPNAAHHDAETSVADRLANTTHAAARMAMFAAARSGRFATNAAAAAVAQVASAANRIPRAVNSCTEAPALSSHRSAAESVRRSIPAAALPALGNAASSAQNAASTLALATAISPASDDRERLDEVVFT
jgi:hypothetical protein